MSSKVQLFPGHAGWHFVTIDRKNSNVIKALFGLPRCGWGSIPVVVTLGKSVWKTSIFPVAKDETYLMGLKAGVRKKENVKNGDTVALTIRVREI